jgi:hypothetical protein
VDGIHMAPDEVQCEQHNKFRIPYEMRMSYLTAQLTFKKKSASWSCESWLSSVLMRHFAIITTDYYFLNIIDNCLDETRNKIG